MEKAPVAAGSHSGTAFEGTLADGTSLQALLMIERYTSRPFASRRKPIFTAAPTRAGGRPRCPTQVPDTINSYKDWNADADNADKDWRSLGTVYVAGHEIYAVDPETGEISIKIANKSWDRPAYSGPDILAFWPIGTQANEFMLLYSAAKFTDETQSELADFVWGYESVDLATGKSEIADFASFEVIMFSGVRDPNDTSKLYGVYTQLSKHDVKKKELIKRVDLPHAYYCVNISSDGTEIYVGGTNDDIGVYDSESLERIGEIILPSGGDMAAGTMHVVRMGS